MLWRTIEGVHIMQRTLVALVVTSAVALFSVPAFAATATCGTAGSGVWVDLTTGGGGASCFGTGNGTLLNTGATDPVLSTVSGISVLDTTQASVNGTPTLTVTFAPFNGLNGNPTDGTISFNATGLSNVKLGFQLHDGIFLDPNPDWFVFNLLAPVTGTGSFDSDLQFIIELPSDDIQYVVLYGTTTTGTGKDATTPIPGALPLFATGLGALGLLARRRKRKAAALGA